MTICPVKTSEVLACVPDDDDSFCQIIVKYFRLIILHWKVYRWKYDADGTLSAEYEEALCAQIKECAVLNSSNTDWT